MSISDWNRYCDAHGDAYKRYEGCCDCYACQAFREGYYIWKNNGEQIVDVRRLAMNSWFGHRYEEGMERLQKYYDEEKKDKENAKQVTTK